MISNISLIRTQLLQLPRTYHATKEDRMALDDITQYELRGEEFDDEQAIVSQANYMETVEIQEASNDSSSMSDFKFTENDVPMLLCRSAEIGYIDMIVFNRDGDFYLHHNYYLPFLPLAALSCPNILDRTGSFLVVCGTAYEIEFFDLDQLDSIHPITQLGGSKRIRDKNGKKRVISMPNSHSATIIGLDVSPLHPNVLASCGEDGVKLWDLLTMNFLADVRQGCCSQVRWHPSAAQTLLTCGLADRTLMLHAFAASQNSQIYQNDADFEQVEWLEGMVIFTDEMGQIGLVDVDERALKQKLQLFPSEKKRPLTALAVHQSQRLVLVGCPEIGKVCVLAAGPAGLHIIDYYDSKPAFSAAFLPDYDGYACVLGHGDGTVTLFQVYSRIGAENIKDLVESPQEFMQMKDICISIEATREEADDE